MVRIEREIKKDVEDGNLMRKVLKHEKVKCLEMEKESTRNKWIRK